MIPGIMPSLQIAGGPGATLAFVTSAVDIGGSTVTMPADIEAGDIILVMSVAATGTTTIPTEAYGTGFTSLFTGVSSEALPTARTRWTGSYKIAAGTEGGTGIGGFMNSAREIHYVAVYRPDGFTPGSLSVAGSDVAVEPDDAHPPDITIPSASSTANITLIMAVSGAAENTASSDFTGETPDDTLKMANEQYWVAAINGRTPNDVFIDWGSVNRDAQFQYGAYIEVL